jgi:hypothetical protein
MTHTPAPLNPALIYPLSDGQLKQLMTDLHTSRVETKQGMSYLAAWDVKATLIRVFGFGGFSSELIESEIVKAVEVPQASNNGKMNWAITAKATVRLTIPQLGAVYTEAAIAGSKQPDFTESADMALKSAESDALKRAAIFLGTQFGLSLYNNGQTKEVISTVLAPGQEYYRGVRSTAKAQEDREAPQERPSSAGESVAHLRAEGVTEEQHAKNVDLLNQAMSAKKKQQELRGEGVPVALDRSLDGDPDADLYAPMDASEGVPSR